MRHAAPYKPDLTALDAYTASVRDWFADLLAFLFNMLAHPLARQRQRAYKAWEIRSVAHGLRYVFFTRALVQSATPFRGPSERFYLRATHMLGQRAARRALTREILAPCMHGTLEQRVAALKHLLDHPDAALARVIARARRVLTRLRVMRLVHDRPARTAPRFQISPATCAHADTS